VAYLSFRWCPMMSCEITPSIAFVIKKTVTKCFHLFLNQNITYVFHVSPSTTCVCPSDFSKLATQLTTSIRARHSNMKTAKSAWLLLVCWLQGCQTVCRSHRSITWCRLTSRENERACSEQNRYEVRWHVVSRNRQSLTVKLNEQTDKLRRYQVWVYRQTLFIGKQVPSPRCRIGRNMKLTTPRPGIEIYKTRE